MHGGRRESKQRESEEDAEGWRRGATTHPHSGSAFLNENSTCIPLSSIVEPETTMAYLRIKSVDIFFHCGSITLPSASTATSFASLRTHNRSAAALLIGVALSRRDMRHDVTRTPSSRPFPVSEPCASTAFDAAGSGAGGGFGFRNVLRVPGAGVIGEAGAGEGHAPMGSSSASPPSPSSLSLPSSSSSTRVSSAAAARCAFVFAFAIAAPPPPRGPEGSAHIVRDVRGSESNCEHDSRTM